LKKVNGSKGGETRLKLAIGGIIAVAAAAALAGSYLLSNTPQNRIVAESPVPALAARLVEVSPSNPAPLEQDAVPSDAWVDELDETRTPEEVRLQVKVIREARKDLAKTLMAGPFDEKRVREAHKRYLQARAILEDYRFDQVLDLAERGEFSH
jgi:hypothetical protein